MLCPVIHLRFAENPCDSGLTSRTASAARGVTQGQEHALRCQPCPEARRQPRPQARRQPGARVRIGRAAVGPGHAAVHPRGPALGALRLLQSHLGGACQVDGRHGERTPDQVPALQQTLRVESWTALQLTFFLRCHGA